MHKIKIIFEFEEQFTKYFLFQTNFKKLYSLKKSFKSIINIFFFTISPFKFIELINFLKFKILNS